MRGFPTGTYATPTTTALGAPTANLTPTGDIATGIAVLFGGVPEQGLTGTLSASGTTSYLLTQLQTTVAASAGDTATCTLQLRYSEN